MTCLSSTSFRHCDSVYNLPPISLVERLFKRSWALSRYSILWLAKSGSKMPCILSSSSIQSSSFFKILLFYSVLSTPRFEELLFSASYSKNPKNLKTYVFGYETFRYENLKIVPLIAGELFNRNLSTVHPTLFLNFIKAP